MKSVIMCLGGVFFSITSFSQVIMFQDLDSYESTRVKANSYVGSNGDVYSVGGEVYFDNFEERRLEVSFLKDNVGKGSVSYAEIKEFDLKIHKVKLIELQDEKRAQLIVVDQNTMFKYKLDVELALDSNQLFLVKKKTIPRYSDVLSNGNPIGENRIDSSVVLKHQFSLEAADAKEMLHMSALEMKKFTRGYNRSLLLMTGGTVLTTIVIPRVNSSYQSSIFIVGGLLFIGGAVQGISARQHIGRSGAYLEAYANGVRIRF